MPDLTANNEKDDPAVSELHRFLSHGFCADCSDLLLSRLRSLPASSRALDGIRIPKKEGTPSSPPSSSVTTTSCTYPSSPADSGSSTLSCSSGLAVSVPMKALDDSARKSSASSNAHIRSREECEVTSAKRNDWDQGRMTGGAGHPLSSEQQEWIRISQVKKKTDFFLIEKVKGRKMNVLKGLELHAGVFDAKEQEEIVNCVYEFQKLGRAGRLRERTYSEPRKWMRGKGRVTIQFGCCYNYATDRNGNPPGIIRDEEVDPLPPMFKMMIKRMVRWHVLPPSCVPNSCIVNIYNEGDCIPPHIDHHDFVRPFCTVSFLSECNILFGQNIEIVGPGDFSAPIAIPLPIGSVFIINGNGADVAKHCVPACPSKRISITFRKMDEAKIPIDFKPDPELQGIRPLECPEPPRVQGNPKPSTLRHHKAEVQEVGSERPLLRKDDFPPLRILDSSRQKKVSKSSIRQ